MAEPVISENSRRIAHNTVLLYFRMLVMLVIGLFTYRVVLRSLGVTDYGVYEVVSGVLTMFMIVMNTVSAAISRFITVGLGKGDKEELKTIFGTSLAIMAAFCLLIALLTETLGLWYLHNKVEIPWERMEAAEVVLQTSLLVLIINLMSVPYTAVINAHEHMNAYAWLSILEGVLKLAVAFALMLSPADTLVLYAWLLLGVAVIARGSYVLYSRKHFPEAWGKLRCSGPLVKEMGAFAGWNFIGSGTYMLNTQGVNQLMNHFFGLPANAARGVATKVEQVVRQFATNIALAVNPQLTKSYVSGNRDYAYDLVCKASKYYFWVLWVLTLPFLLEADTILTLWVGADKLPPEAAIFTRLTLLCFLVDFSPSTLTVLEQAGGKIRNYYLITSAIAVLVFPVTWLLFYLGYPSWVGYTVFIGLYLLKSVAMLCIVHHDTGLPVKKYLRESVLPMLYPSLLTLLVVWPAWRLLPKAWWTFLVVAALGVVFQFIACWSYGFTRGEKAFIRSKIKRK